tara:strand:+ start:401 stop:592 length:192 start_codon:yes stop_codon:yes gene_type:complete
VRCSFGFGSGFRLSESVSFLILVFSDFLVIIGRSESDKSIPAPGFSVYLNFGLPFCRVIIRKK